MKTSILSGRRPHCLLAPALFFVLVAAALAHADFADGLKAYDRGDLGTAAAKWREAAASGDLDAVVALAGLYEQGMGVPQDRMEAARLYRIAAEQDHRIAQLNLGEILATGRGVQRDVVSAYLWLALAANQGSHWAAEQRTALAKTLTAAERSEADALIAAHKQP